MVREEIDGAIPRPRQRVGADGTATRPALLVVVSHYLPGYLAGGPVRSIEGIVEHLGDEFDIFIVTSDRDFGSQMPFPGIRTGQWVARGRAHVMYLNRRAFTARRLRRLLLEVEPEVLYLNSLFSVRFMVLPALVARVVRRSLPIVVAPRGSLDPGALVLGHTKKRLFLAVLKPIGLTRAVNWQATSRDEKKAIESALGPVRVSVAANFAPAVPEGRREEMAKEPGRVRMVFLSRVVPKKNLLFALERLASVQGTVELTVAGPQEDVRYWAQCQRVIAEQLPHVRVSVVGAVPHDEVSDLLGQHHFFLLPTLGENFGHSILEALGSGLGVLVSDRTPWRGLVGLGAGWDLDLADVAGWEQALQRCCDMDQAEFSTLSKAARQARSILPDVDEAVRANRRLFRTGSAR
jgi:glycosyltransferase involved in cell wall biosynthesis